MERLFKRVWVLGAGFSRSLGGPTLADLFKEEPYATSIAGYPVSEYETLAEHIYTAKVLFNWGRSSHARWADAEQFLAFVDAANDEGPKARLLKAIAESAHEWDPINRRNVSAHDFIKRSAPTLRSVVRRALAAESSMFSIATDLSEEQALPYLAWIDSLDPIYDTVITFNYDLVLERLSALALGKLDVVPPEGTPAQGKVPVFKLHGSVNWTGEGKGTERVEIDSILRKHEFMPAIAAPGRSKAPKGVPPFPSLWLQARYALMAARWVGFIGYRFPPTDAMAAQYLGLSLVAEANGQVGRARRFDIVLGDNIHAPDIARLQTLLGTFRGFRRLYRDDAVVPKADGNYLRIVRQPLWAEDFISRQTVLVDETELL